MREQQKGKKRDSFGFLYRKGAAEEKKTARRPRHFFVDYENVNREGLRGVVLLEAGDCVNIYYSEAAKTLTFDLHRQISASKAHFNYIKVDLPIKNAVDCQILFDLRDMSKGKEEVEYFIVSRDTDFDRTIAYFQERSIDVKKLTEICECDGEIRMEPVKLETSGLKPRKRAAKPKRKAAAKAVETVDPQIEAAVNASAVQPAAREAAVRNFFDQKLTPKLYGAKKEEAIQAVLRSKNTNEVNNNLQIVYRGESVKPLYKALKPLLKNLTGDI